MAFDFEKNQTVESLDTVPEQYRPLYAEVTEGEHTGKFAINGAFKPLVGELSGSQRSLSKVRSDLKTANDESAQRRIALRAFEDIMESLEIDEDSRTADGLKAKIADILEQSKNGKDLKINLDKVRAEMTAKHAKEIEAKDTEISKREAALTRYLISDSATRALAEAKGSVALLLPHVNASCKVMQDEDGEYVVRVLDAQGEVRYGGDGKPMTVKGFVAEMKTQEAFMRAFESEGGGGTGTRPGATGRRSDVTARSGDKTSVDKISAGLAARMKR